MKCSFYASLSLVVSLLNSNIVQASLVNIGNGLVYDSVANVTWTQDANLFGTMQAADPNLVSKIIAAVPSVVDLPSVYDTPSFSGVHVVNTSDFFPGGMIDWFGSKAFVGYLNSINFKGHNNWTLPTTYVQNCFVGFNCTDSPLGELFYIGLGGIARQSIITTHNANFNLFTNIQYDNYWTLTEEIAPFTLTYDFAMVLFMNGYQHQEYKAYGAYLWPVLLGNAALGPLAPGNIDASTVRLFVSGSYLKQSILEPALLGLFQPGSVSVFQDGTVTSGIGKAIGENYRVYFGIAKTTAQNAAVPASLSGQKVLVVETSQGDSAYGVIPVVLASPVSILSVDAACAPTGGVDAAGQPLWACPNTVSAVPDAAMTDVEPALFQGINQPTALPGLSPSQQANLTVIPVIGQVMGIVATNNFLTMGPGGTDMLPSLTKPQIVSLMNGLTTDWNWVDASIAAGPVALCRGVQGSGSQAVIDALLFGFPCSVSPLNPATHAKTANFGAGGGNYVVIENASPDALAKCMGYVQNGTPAGMTIDITTGTVSNAPADSTHVVLPAGGRGIGMMSLNRPSRDAISEPYHFVAIDGVSPSMTNAATGAYDLTVESVMARRNVTVNGIAPLTGGQLDLYNYLSTAVDNPTILGAAKTPSAPGVAALANPANHNYDPTTTVYNGQTILLNPVLRVERSGGTCTPQMQVQ